MFIKIYFGDKPLFLCDELNEEIKQYSHHDDAVFIDEFSAASVNSMIHEMKQEKVHAVIFYWPDLPKLKKAFWKKFQVISAGGGIVCNEKQEILFIFRRGKWDLPKGKLDEGEKIEDCALREVKEETGIKDVTLDKFLLTTFHTYDENGKHILKESHWFMMRSSENQQLIPQQEEQITALKWVGRPQLASLLTNTFPSIVDVIAAIKH